MTAPDRQPLALPLTLDRGYVKDTNGQHVAHLSDCTVLTASNLVAAVNKSAALTPTSANELEMWERSGMLTPVAEQLLEHMRALASLRAQNAELLAAAVKVANLSHHPKFDDQSESFPPFFKAVEALERAIARSAQEPKP